MKKNKRIQASKRQRAIAAALNGRPEYIEGMRQIRRSNAAQPHKSLSKYDRTEWREVKQRGQW